MAALGFFKAQDKLIFKDGKSHTCKIISINKNTVTYKDSIQPNLITKSKTEIILAEYANGAVYIFGEETVAEENPAENKKQKEIKPPVDNDGKNNILGTQLFGTFLGRAGLVYERLFLNQQVGVAIPAFITYNPYSHSSNTNAVKIAGVGFITGADLNYYFKTKLKYTLFFLGPRVRYGSDLILNNSAGSNITALTVQAQNGFVFKSMENPAVSHMIAFGFGFVRIMTASGNSNVNAKQSYPWMSMTYRINFKW